MTAEELAVLRKTLEIGAEKTVSEETLSALPTLQVIGGCSCGCASFDFTTDPNRRPGVLAEAVQVLPDGNPLGVIVWGTPDQIDGVEIWDTFDTPQRLLPDPEKLKS